MFSAGKACSDDSAAGRRILVVRLSSMGDIIHALPAVATIKHSFPGSIITWAVHPRWMPLLEANPFIDRVITLGGSLLDGWRVLRSTRCDIAVDFQGLFRSALVGTVAHPEHLYGLHQSEARERLAALFYSHRVRTAGPHQVDRNLELARAAGASMVLRQFPLPEGAPQGDLPDGGFVLACPVSGWAGKQWPAEHWAALAQRLRGELGLALVLNGAPGAENLLASVPGAWPHTSGIPGLIHATRRAIAVVGTDSGPVHLAAALGRPGVAIYGPTDPARNGPYGTSFTVLREPSASTTYRRHRKPHASMWRVHPDAVFEALDARIGARSAGPDALP